MMKRTLGIAATTVALVVGQGAAAQATTETKVKTGTYAARDGDMTTSNGIFFRVHGKGHHKTIRDLLFGNQCLTQSESNPPNIAISKAGKFDHVWTGHSEDNYHASLSGRFTRPNRAKGTLKINDNGCTSTFHFTAKHPCSTSKEKYKCPVGIRP